MSQHPFCWVTAINNFHCHLLRHYFSILEIIHKFLSRHSVQRLWRSVYPHQSDHQKKLREIFRGKPQKSSVENINKRSSCFQSPTPLSDFSSLFIGFFPVLYMFRLSRPVVSAFVRLRSSKNSDKLFLSNGDCMGSRSRIPMIDKDRDLCSYRPRNIKLP